MATSQRRTSKQGADKRDVRFTQGDAALKITSKFTPYHIFLQVSVNGSQPMWFNLDTGNPGSLIFQQCSDGLGLKFKDVKANDGRNFKVTEDAAIGLTGVKVSNQRFTLANHIIEERGFSDPICGILGYDFINRFVIELDYRASVVNLYKPDEYKYHSGGLRIPINLEHLVPVARLTAITDDGTPLEGNFLIDLGAFHGVLVTRRFANAHNLLTGLGIGLRQIRAGNILFPIHSGDEYKRNRNFVGEPEQTHFDVLIGNDFLKNFKVVFNYFKKEMVLEPNSSTYEH